MNDPLAPHSHEPNPQPPSPDPSLVLRDPTGQKHIISVANLRALPAITLADCYIVSTGHGTSGPFAFTGVALVEVLNAYLLKETAFSQVEVISPDGFGTRVSTNELATRQPANQIILAYSLAGQVMTRAQGLVRLIVPDEVGDALRQVKWVRWINCIQA